MMARTLGDEARERFPRLIAALCSASGLDEAQAVEALVEYHVFGIRDELASPPVAALGGQFEAIRHAFGHRNVETVAKHQTETRTC